MEEKMFKKEIEMQRESRQFQLQMMHHWYTVVVRHHFHHLWQHPLNILTSKDQCIHLMMMILHKFNYMRRNL